MLSAVSTWSEVHSGPPQGDDSHHGSPFLAVQDWVLAAAAVLAVVFAVALDSDRGAKVGACIVASAAVCAAVVPWLWATWMERRADLVLGWRLAAISLGMLAAAQIASAVVVIGNDNLGVLPAGIDLLRLVGAGIGVASAVVTVTGHVRLSHIERTVLIPSLIASSASAILLFVFAVTVSPEHPPTFSDWLIASAALTLPLSAALIYWIAIVRPASQWNVQSVSLAFGWTAITIVLAGAAADRLLDEQIVTARTNWTMLPAAAFFAASALRVLPAPINTAKPAGGAAARNAGDVILEPRNWLRELAPIAVVIVAASVTILAVAEEWGVWSAIVAAIASVVAVRVLFDQVTTQTRNSRAARRLEQARLELATQANVDPVTGLPNRRALDDRLAEEVERALRYKQPLSLCFVDLDHFKQVNDHHGHAAGDAALAQVGSILRHTARGIDFVGRFGGEEFIVLVPGTWSEDATILGERLRRSVAEHTFNLGGNRSVRLTISVGVAGLPEHALDAQSLNELADRALYTAKRSGRNQVVLFEPAP